MTDRSDDVPARRDPPDDPPALLDRQSKSTTALERLVFGVWLFYTALAIYAFVEDAVSSAAVDWLSMAIFCGVPLFIGGMLGLHYRQRTRPLRGIGDRVQTVLADRADKGSLRSEAGRWACTVEGLPLAVEAARLPPDEKAIAARVSAGVDAFLTLDDDALGPRAGLTITADHIELRRSAPGLSPDEVERALEQFIEAARLRHVTPQTRVERLVELARADSLAAFQQLCAEAPDHPAIVELARTFSRSDDPERRLAGVRRLGRGPLSFLIEDRTLPDEWRAAGLAELAEHGETRWLLERIGRWLSDPALAVAAIRLLGALGERPDGAEAIPRLRGLIRTDDETAEQAARMVAVAEALGRHPDPACTAPLLTLVDHPASAVRAAAIVALGAVGTAVALPRLGELAPTDEQANRAIAAIRARLQGTGGGLSVAARDARGGLAVVERDAATEPGG